MTHNGNSLANWLPAVAELRVLSRQLITWFRRHRRHVPWRPEDLSTFRDPYATWVSETMLQQTRVETVQDHFRIWMHDYPDIHALAHASEADVLRHWQGLGYYSRARNLHRGAQILVDQGGAFPHDREGWLRVPGVGEYTAGAILSLAQHKAEPLLDGNLIRIFSRLCVWRALPSDSSAWKNRYWDLARRFSFSAPSHLVNEALMELGALVCVPRNPNCAHCPWLKSCHALAENSVSELPPRKEKPASQDVRGLLFCVIRNGMILLHRSLQGFLAAQWRLPWILTDAIEPSPVPSPAFLAQLLPRNVKIESCGTIRHSITRYRIKLGVYLAELPSGAKLKRQAHADCRWIPLERFQNEVANSLSLKGFEAAFGRKKYRPTMACHFFAQEPS
ncbi:MAG TPA: A/G-specific adenine glycosylase [Fibrobacteraceae bacterium]|nr:A/G-specific adenine glycosylase [Fibrobacteraceae bacterium]